MAISCSRRLRRVRKTPPVEAMSTAPAAPSASLKPLPDNAQVLRVAIPVVLSGLSTPLIGLIDTAAVGQLGDAKYIGAVALGTLIFTFLYWAFGFLRMGTTGLTAQAFGAENGVEIRACLGRALLIALAAGTGLILLQVPLEFAAFTLVGAEADAEALARTYFDIRIWSAPFALANFALLGWFIGLQRMRTALALQLFLNGMNAGLDALFVFVFEMGVAGIAYGTLIAEVSAALAGLLLATRVLKSMPGGWDLAALKDKAALTRTIAVNRDIMIRTLLLLFAFAFFTAQSAGHGNEVLAANTILMQFVSFAAYFLDGFAFAAEALVGEALGAKRREAFARAVKLSTLWAAGISLLLSAGFALGGPFFIALLTTAEPVRALAGTYLVWAAVLPIASVWCYQLDGIFIGATRTGEMRNAAIFSLAVFLACWWLFQPLGNHGLWAAFTLFALMRALSLAVYYPRLAAQSAGAAA